MAGKGRQQHPTGIPCSEVSAREAGYLLALHGLQRQPTPATQVALARAMGVSAPTALEMVRRLRTMGLVEPDGLTLTREGISAALTLAARRHAAQVLTEEVLGIAGDSVEPEVARLAPNLSPKMVQRLNARRAGRAAGPS